MPQIKATDNKQTSANRLGGIRDGLDFSMTDLKLLRGSAAFRFGMPRSIWEILGASKVDDHRALVVSSEGRKQKWGGGPKNRVKFQCFQAMSQAGKNRWA